jgi:hypothetical protein
MVFNWKITRPPFHATVESVTVMHPSIEVEFETGSIGEAHGIFTDNKTELGQMFGAEVMGSASTLALNVGETEVETEKQRKARERKEKKNNNDPASASAPDPIVIPGVAPDTTLPPPLPPVPSASPAPPPSPPTGILAGKITVELDRRVSLPTTTDGGQGLADWLATSGITVKGATYPEAVTVLRLQTDEKLGPIANALGVA